MAVRLTTSLEDTPRWFLESLGFTVKFLSSYLASSSPMDKIYLQQSRNQSPKKNQYYYMGYDKWQPQFLRNFAEKASQPFSSALGLLSLFGFGGSLNHIFFDCSYA